MQFSKESFRTFFLAAWGAVVLFFQVPVIGMVLQDPQSLNLAAWNGLTFLLFCLSTFLLVPAVFGLLIWGFSRISARSAMLVLAMATGFCLSMQVNFHYLQPYFMEAAWRKPAQAAILLAWVVGFWIFRRTFLDLLKICALLSLGVLVSFAFQAAPGRVGSYVSPAQIGSWRSQTGPVFILTFEKLSLTYVADEHKKILADRLPNLARLVSEADYYPEAYSNSTATIYGLRTLYSGRIVTTDRGWTRHPNLRDLIGGRQIYMLMDLLTDYCDPHRHHCIRTIGQQQAQGWDLISGWYETYLMTILPDPLERPLVLMGWHFNPWYDQWAREEEGLGKRLWTGDYPAGVEPAANSVYHKVGRRQFQALKDLVQKEKGAPDLYIMHSFISDGFGITRVGAKDAAAYPRDLEKGRRNLSAFDQELGSFINLLKQEGIYDRSLILITTDTGADEGVNSIKGETEFPAYSDTANIFMVIKRPGQKAGRVFRSVIRHVDVLPTLLSDLGVDPVPFHFEGVPVTNPDETATLAQRPLHFLVTPKTMPILHYELRDPNGSFRRTR